MTSSRNQLLIGVVAAIAAIGAYWMLILSPKRDEASRLSTEITSMRDELTTAQAQLGQYRKAKESYKSNYATVARLGKAVPEDDDVRSLVVQLDDAARRTKVDFRSIRIADGTSAPASTAKPNGAAPPPGASVGEAGFVTMPFSFDFQGKYFSLSKFLTQLERYVAVRNQSIDVTGRLLVLDNLSLQPSQDGFPNIDAKIGAVSYLLPPGQTATGGATTTNTASSGGSALTTIDGAK